MAAVRSTLVCVCVCVLEINYSNVINLNQIKTLHVGNYTWMLLVWYCCLCVVINQVEYVALKTLRGKWTDECNKLRENTFPPTTWGPALEYLITFKWKLSKTKLSFTLCQNGFVNRRWNWLGYSLIAAVWYVDEWNMECKCDKIMQKKPIVKKGRQDVGITRVCFLTSVENINEKSNSESDIITLNI